MRIELFDAGRVPGWHEYSGTASQVERSLRSEYHWYGRRVRPGDLEGLLQRLRGGRLLSVRGDQGARTTQVEAASPTFIRVAEVLFAYPNPCLQEACTTCWMRRWIEDAGRHVVDLQAEVASLDLKLVREAPHGWAVLTAMLQRYRSSLDLPVIGRAWACQDLDEELLGRARTLMGRHLEFLSTPRRRSTNSGRVRVARSAASHLLSRTGRKISLPAPVRMQLLKRGLYGLSEDREPVLVQSDLARFWARTASYRLAGTWGHTPLSEAFYWVEANQKERVFFRLPFQRRATDPAQSIDTIEGFLDAYRAFRGSREYKKVSRLEAISSFGPGEIRIKVGADPRWRYHPLAVDSGNPFPKVDNYAEAPVSGVSLIRSWTA